MYLPLERNNDEERPDPLSEGFFFQKCHTLSSKKEFKTKSLQNNKETRWVWTHTNEKKKKNSAMQFKIGDLDELPFEQFFMSILSQAYTIYI